MDPVRYEHLLTSMFTQSLDAIFFMMLDEPVRWDDSVDQDAVLDYVLTHQRVTIGNPAFYAQHHAEPQHLHGRTPLDFYADPEEPRRVWRFFLDAGFLHQISEIHRLDGSVMWLEGDYLWLKDEHGAYTGSFCIQRDVTQRHETERALRATEARFAALFNQSHDAVFFLDLKGRHIVANQRAADMLGYTIEELPCLSYVNTSAEPVASEQVLTRLLAGEKLPIFKRQFVRKSGEHFPAEVNVELVRDGDGKPAYIQSVVRDISLREALQAEAERRAAYAEALNRVIDACIVNDAVEPLFQTALREVTDVLHVDGGRIYTPSRTVTYNVPLLPTAPNQLGKFEVPLCAELVVDDWSTLATENPRLQEAAQQALHLGLHALLLVELTPNDKRSGVMVLTHSQPHVWQAEQIAFVKAVGRQISMAAERIRLEQALHGSEERYRTLSEMITDYACVIRVDAGDRIHLEWEREGALPQMTGYSRDELMAMGGPMSAIIPEDRLKAKLNWSPDLQVEDAEFRIRHKDGTIRWLRRVCQGEKSQDPSVVGRLYETLSDITARKQAEEKVLALSLENARAQVLGKFIRDASHEFRTPLSIINLNIYALQRLHQDEKQLKRLVTIAGQVHVMDQLVDSLLILSQLDSNQQMPSVQVNVNAVLASEFDAQRTHTLRKGLTFDLLLHPTLPPISGHMDYLGIAIRKLLDNAVRFTPAGHVKARTSSDGNFVIIEISDSGIGMSAETQTHIFERFFRQDDAHTDAGFGLGLPIAQRIAEYHNGFITVDSQLGEGSTFRVHLPIT